MTASLTHTAAAGPPAEEGERADEPSPRARHRWAWALLGLVLLAALAAVHLLLGRPMRVPIIHPDELGYLDNARYLARGGLKPETQYYPGFSVLLIPLWLARSSPLWVWRGALDVNAGLAALSGLVTWALCGRLAPGLTGWRRLAVTAVVCAYPASLLYSDLALSEVLFAVLFGLVVLVAAAAVARREARWWALLGVLTGALVMVHPRGLAVVVAVLLLGAVALEGWRRRAASGVALVAGLTLALAVTRVLVTATRGPTLNGFAAYQPDSVVSKSLSAHGMVSLLWTAAGQLFYLSVATVGLVPLGLFVGLGALVAVLRGDRSPRQLTRAFVALAFLGVWALSSMYMNLGQRADKLVYGRYNEAVIAPLLVLALAELVGAGRHRRFSWRGYAARRWLFVGAVTTAISGGLVWYGDGRAALHGDLNPGNVLALYPIVHHSGWVDVPLAGALALAALVVLTLLAWRTPALVVLVAVAGLFAGSAAFTQQVYLSPGSRSRARENVIAAALASAGQFGLGSVCVGFDPSADPALQFNYFATRFLVPDQQFQWFQAAAPGARPCGPLVVSGNGDFATYFPGARRITFEDDVDLTLWVVPGPLQDRLAAAGWLLPDPPGAPLPGPARHAVVTAPAAQGRITTVAPARQRTVAVTVLHDGGGAPWPAAAGLKSGAGAVRLSVAWYPSGRLPSPGDVGSPVRTANLELPRTLLPGQSARLAVPLVAADDHGTPLATGTYEVHLAVYQEGAPSFTDPGLTLDVAVTP